MVFGRLFLGFFCVFLGVCVVFVFFFFFVFLGFVFFSWFWCVGWFSGCTSCELGVIWGWRFWMMCWCVFLFVGWEFLGEMVLGGCVGVWRLVCSWFCFVVVFDGVFWRGVGVFLLVYEFFFGVYVLCIVLVIGCWVCWLRGFL